MLVKFPLVDVKKGSVSDDVLARYFARNVRQKSDSVRNTSVAPKFERLPRLPMYDIPLDDGEIGFIDDVLKNPDDGVKLRYKRLGLGVGTANRMKDKLIDQGWLETQKVSIGRTRKVLLRLTAKARDVFGIDSDEPNRGSLVHEYWKGFYAQRFREMGYKVQLEAPRNSGNVDVLAVMDGKTTGIEIETGKSDILQNVRQNLLSGFDRIVIVATDSKAYDKVEILLAKERLLGIDRISLVLQDEGCEVEI